MKTRTTIKDIAARAGVSLSTVHASLNNKPGVGEQTRNRICEIAKELDYHSNTVAASLKRKPYCIAALFPQETGEYRYYYADIWKGFRDYMKTLADFSIKAVEIPYRDEPDHRYIEEKLDQLSAEGQIDGIISVGYSSSGIVPPVGKYSEAGIPVALVGNDNEKINRLCCVQTHYRILGEILGEILTSRLGGEDEVLLCIGNETVPSHFLIVEGFDSYIQKYGIKNRIIRIPGYDSVTYEKICEQFHNNYNIKSCSSVTARGSIFLGKAIESCGRKGSVLAVGSDLFPENMCCLEQGIFSNLLHKNTYRQAYVATQYLTEYLLRNIAPPSENVYVRSEVLFRSSIPMYQCEAASGNHLYIS